ncbi:uncharacterized protein LOC134250770, partial [Saccostrea cucullata]|uniref:uncharacterized protein LOC134250770 n=1 Tax=Saccostrea cuccullata TaxID=36930 RepID=UPI002ED0EF88
MEKAAASGFQKQKSESKSENDISMHASDKNLQKKVEDVQRYERYCPRVVSVFRSGERESERELKITKYQFKRWTFLVTAKESKDILKKKLEDIQTEITLKIANACCTVEYFSRQHEKNFESWVERCSKVTEACFRDLELLSVNGEVEAIQHLSKQIQKANEDHFISLFEMKGVSGIFLLGRGEHIIEVILASHAYFKNFIIQRPENNENIAYKVFDISSLQCRCMAAFNGIEQTKEKYPYLKVYQSGENVKMIGNENDCAAASEFLKTNGWMTGVQYGRCKQLICFEFFLKRVNVQAFIDGGITKYAGTWAVTKCTEPLNNELVFIYGKTRSDVEGILNVILESIKIKEISITSAACNEKNIQKWKAYAEKFEQSFGGKFSLQISTQKDPGLVAYFVFTADLEDEESLKILVNEIELEIPRKEKISVEPKHLIWLQKCYFDILKTEAKKNGIDLKFVSKNNVHQVEITGLSTALMEIKHLIHSICPKEQNILLPFASLPSKVTDFLRDSQCCFEYCPFKNSRLWIKGTTGIVVYKGEYGTDCLYSLLQVRALESEGK